MSDKKHYFLLKENPTRFLNVWDALVFMVIMGTITAIVWAGSKMALPYEIGEPIAIDLAPHNLFRYALSSVMRMGIALFFSFLFTFTIGTLAAKNKHAERIIIPFIDIMQSVPILGFQAISIMTFIYLFPGSLLGPESAAIFAIFTSQVWNMALCFYQSLRTLPRDLKEAAAIFHLNGWQKFWRIEVPYAMPSLLWNTMMSLSAGWFFVVASEAISVSNQHITLPGIGSYIDLALVQENYHAITYAVIAMLGIILLYDQLIFRPLLSWSEKFKPEPDAELEEGTWFLDLMQRSRILGLINIGLKQLKNWVINLKIERPRPKVGPRMQVVLNYTTIVFWQGLTGTLLFGAMGFLIYFVYQHLTWGEALTVLRLGLITGVKVFILIILASLVWVPIGAYVGFHHRLSKIVQPIAQFCAAFPADIVYPAIMMFIITYDLNIEVWSTPLMILGTQWYILFNVIAGTQALPQDLKLAVQNYGVKGWLWWKRLLLPAIFPYYITGAMAAAGGCWNASIIADVIRWGDVTIRAQGLGGYISEVTHTGDFPRIALGIGVMCILVIIINRLLWQRLYDLAESRYQIGALHE